MSIDGDISFQLLLDSAFIERSGFGLACYMASASFSEDYKILTKGDAADLQAAGDISSALQSVIETIFQHPLAPGRIVLGARGTDAAQVDEITINAAAEDKYSVDINGTNAAYTGGATDTTTDIATNLASAINALSEPVTASASAAVVSVTADTAGEGFTTAKADDNEGDLSIATTTANVSVRTELDAIKSQEDIYAVALDDKTATDTDRVDDWAQTNEVTFYAQRSVASWKTNDDTDQPATWKSEGQEYTIPIYEPDDTDPVGMQVASAKLTADPDEKSTQWKWLTLSGIEPEEFTATEIAAMRSKNVNFYTTALGQGAFADGRTSKGRPIDVRLVADWMKARVQEDIVALFLEHSNRNSKIKYNNDGFGKFEQIIEERYDQGVSVGHFNADTLEIDMPDANDIDAATKRTRKLTFEFGCEISGAVESVGLTGTVTVEFNGFA